MYKVSSHDMPVFLLSTFCCCIIAGNAVVDVLVMLCGCLSHIFSLIMLLLMVLKVMMTMMMTATMMILTITKTATTEIVIMIMMSLKWTVLDLKQTNYLQHACTDGNGAAHE